MIKVYSDYHTPTIVYALDGDQWWIVPAVSDGWSRRCAWRPAPAYVRQVMTVRNRVTFFGVRRWAGEWFGMPSAEVDIIKPDDYERMIANDPR